MSESIFAPELAPGTPGYDEYMRARGRALSIPASNAVSGAVSLGTFPQPDVQPGPIESWLPGAVTRMGGGLLGTADAVSKLIDQLTYVPDNAIRKTLGLPPRSYEVEPTPQYVTRLEDLGESSRKAAEAIVHPVQPENQAEQVLADVGDQTGLMALPIPNSAITRLPTLVQRGLSPLLHVFAPLAEHAIAPFFAGAGLTTATDAAAIAQQNAEDAKNGAQPGQPPQPTNTTTSQPVAPQAPPVTPETQQTPAPPPVQQTAPTFSLTPPAAAATTQAPQFTLQAPTQQAAPQFTLAPPSDSDTKQAQPQTGESGIPWPAYVAGATVLASPFLGIRFGRGAMESRGLIGRPDMSAGTPYAEQAQKFRTFATGPNPDWGMQNRPAAPLAVAPAQAAALRAQAYTQDDTALLRAHVANSDASNQALAHEIGDVKNQSAQQARIDSYMETGLHPASGVQTVVPQETLLKYGRLDNSQKEVVNDALWAATEQDHRTNMFKAAMQKGQPYDPLAARRYFRDNDDDNLRQKIQAGLADPETASVVRDVWQMGQGNLSMMNQLSYPLDELRRVQTQQPHYIPSVREDGTPVSIFHARDTDTFSGPRTPPTPAIDAFMQHQDGLLKQMENDVLNRKIIDSDALAKTNNPDHEPMFTLKETPKGEFAAGTAEPSVVIPRRDGWETHLINNPEIEQAMKGNPVAKRTTMQASRNWFTQFTTGPGALLGGEFFPAVHGLTRGPYLQMLNTPKDMYATMANRAYQQAGGKSAVGNFLTRLVPDPYLGAPAMAMKTLYDRAQHAIGNTLMRGAGNPGNMLLRHVWGDTAIDNLRQRMIDNYQKSLTYRWRARGGAGSGNYGRMQVPAYQRSSRTNAIVSNPAATLAPHAVTPASWLGKRMPYATNLNNLVREVFGSFMEAPNMYSYALNESNPNISQARLINESRALLGDPGKRGSGAVTQFITRNVPYSNATIQDISRATRAKAEMPIGRFLSRASLLGTGAAATLYSAMHTPGGLAHLHNLVGTNQLATGPILYNGNDTDNTTQISLPQSERAYWPFILDAMGHLSGAWDAHKDEDTFERAYHTLASMFSQHISNETFTAAAHGLSQSVDPFIGVAPALGAAVTALTGKEPRLQADRILDQAMRGRVPSLSTDVTSQSRSPNVAGQDSVLGSAEGNKWEHTLTALLGIGGDALQTLDRGYSSLKHGEGVGTAVERMLDNVAQHFKDKNQMFNNVLWNNATSVNENTPLVEQTNKSLDVMRDAAGAKSDISFGGATRRGGVPLSGEAEQKMQSHDPVMQNMRMMTAAVMNTIDTKFMPHVTDLKKLDSDMNNVQMDEDIRRQKHNEYMREINQAYIPIAQQVAYLNENLSRLAGKKIDISQGKIDWTKGSDQFN